MKTKKLLRHFGKFLDQQAHRRREERASLKSLLAQLRKKRAKLETELGEAEDSEAAAKLKKKIALLAAQIEKGEKILEQEEE